MTLKGNADLSFEQSDATGVFPSLEVDTLDLGSVPGEVALRIRDPEPLYDRTFRLMGFKTLKGSFADWAFVVVGPQVKFEVFTGPDGLYVRFRRPRGLGIFIKR